MGKYMEASIGLLESVHGDQYVSTVSASRRMDDVIIVKVGVSVISLYDQQEELLENDQQCDSTEQAGPSEDPVKVLEQFDSMQEVRSLEEGELTGEQEYYDHYFNATSEYEGYYDDYFQPPADDYV